MRSEQRLHPATLLFDMAGHVKRFAVPGLLVLVGASRSSAGPWGIPSGWEPWLLVMLVPAVLATVARYLSFRIRYDEREMVIRSGLVFRNERHVPYTRIQNVDASQNLFHRFFHVVEVRVETAGGEKEEARLSVLAQAAFDDMKRHVLQARAPLAVESVAEPATSEERGTEGTPAGETLVHLPLRELLLCGLLENKGMVLIGAASGVIWESGLGNSVMGRVMGDSESVGRSFVRALISWFVDGGPLPLARIGFGLAALLVFLVVVRIVSMVWAFVRLYDFRLTRIGDDLRTEYGLFTRVTATVPIRRVQTVTVAAGPLHRWLKRATVRVETAGGVGTQQAGASVREWLAPLIHQDAVAGLVAQVVPGVALESLDWQPVHPRAFRRAIKPKLIGIVLISLVAAIVIGRGATGLALLMLPWAVFTTRQFVAHLGWAESDEVVAMRSGWIWQRLTLARVNKIQAVALRESPFDRRAAMARVRVDTAGASEFTRIDIPYLDGEVARQLSGRLSAQAASTSFRW